MKRVLALLLALTLTASLAAGCAVGGGSGSGPGGGGATTTAGAVKAPEDDMSVHYTISYTPIGADISWDFNSDPAVKHFQDKFNFSWDIIPLTWGDWIERGRIWISAQDMPDVLFTNFNFKDYASWADQDLIKRFPTNWKLMYPNLADVYNQTMLGPALEEVIPGETALFPNIIFFTKPTTPKIAPHFSLYFRKDWASALGYEIKDAYNLQEFSDMVADFLARGSEIGVDAGGMIDTWALNTGVLSGTHFNAQWTDSTRIYKKDGKYVWGPRDPKVFELLEYMQYNINRGVVSPNFASFVSEEENGFFFSGQSFGIFTHGWVGPVNGNYGSFNRNTGLEALDCIQLAVLTDPDGNFQEYEQLNYWSCMMIDPKMDDAKFHRILSLFDYVVTPEAQNIIRMGIEGESWERDADGKFKITRPWNNETNNYVSLSDLYPGLQPFGSFLILGDDFSARSPAIKDEYHKVARTMYATKQRIGIDTGTVKDYNFETAFFQGENYLRLNINVGQELVQLAVEGGDLRGKFETWLAERAPLIDPALDELNEAYGSK